MTPKDLEIFGSVLFSVVSVTQVSMCSLRVAFFLLVPCLA